MSNHIAQLEIYGLRGFSTAQKLELAIPDGKNPGSGLTMLVGPNNSGKSTVYEALREFSHGNERRFAESRRNTRAGSRVDLSVTDTEGRVTRICSTKQGGSAATRKDPQGELTAEPLPPIHIVPSRRAFGHQFGGAKFARDTYAGTMANYPTRQPQLDLFAGRLIHAQDRREEFDKVLASLLGSVPSWFVEESENGHQFVRVVSDGSPHTSEGLGEGFISLLFIVDAIYDAPVGGMILIDEPELSVHPAVQRRIAEMLFSAAIDKQIVYATHSPYFLSIAALKYGGRIARVYSSDTGSAISMLTVATGQEIQSQLANRNNPHVFGLDAREAFFLEDGVVLVEGQEDVVLYPRLLEQLGIALTGSFFGWGIGGAGNMRVFARMLNELGFRKVAGILDAGESNRLPELTKEFPSYLFQVIPADDIRDKEASVTKPANGLLDNKLKLKPKLRNDTAKLFRKVAGYLRNELEI